MRKHKGRVKVTYSLSELSPSLTNENSKMTEERKKERKQDLEVGFKRDEADLKKLKRVFFKVCL